jgi:hypothetical protein
MLYKIKRRIKNFFDNQLVDLNSKNVDIKRLIIENSIQNGRIWSSQLKDKKLESLNEAEFQVFSQWGDDGIIQYLINYLDIDNKTFVEFGVEDYLESNTRFLLINNNWSGLVIDGSEFNIAKIKNDEIYWKHDLIAKSAFITKDNINQLIEVEGISGEIGLLHIDIDGNDYWIWKALTIVKPVIMIVEYNSVFGYERAITIPYEKDFNRTTAHFSNLYAGASLLALCDLAEERGYKFVGSNSAGNNAYFVKEDALKDLKPLSAENGYVKSKFRESRDEAGNLTFIRSNARLEEIKGMNVHNTRSNKIEKL